MFATPGSPPFGYKLTREAAQQVSRNWGMLLFNGALLVFAGFLIFSIQWTVRELATFIGALVIFQGLFEALTTGIDARVRQTNVVAGLLSIATGILIIVWPGPGVVALGIVLGALLIVMGTLTISGAFAAGAGGHEIGHSVSRRLQRGDHHRLSRGRPGGWLRTRAGVPAACGPGGLLEIPLGVLALANPGATLAALVTVAGIWAVAIGVMRIVLAFEIKRLPEDVDEAFAVATHNGSTQTPAPANGQAAPART